MKDSFAYDEMNNPYLFLSDDKDLSNYNMNISDDEENFSFCSNKYYDNTNINEFFGLPTKATMEDQKDIAQDNNGDKEKDKNALFKDEEIPIEKDKDETKIKKSVGRKRQAESGSGKHNRFSDDNLRKKCKHLVLDSVFNFINDKINEKYNGNIGCGRYIKKLLILNQKQKSDASIQFNKEFLNKSLGDIFSEKITTRYTTYHPCHNIYLIKILTSDKDEAKKNYFQKLFSITFVDCLKHFRGSIKIKELEGLNGFNSIKSKYKDDSYYLECLEYYIMHYEEIMRNKRTRKANKKEKKVNEL